MVNTHPPQFPLFLYTPILINYKRKKRKYSLLIKIIHKSPTYVTSFVRIRFKSDRAIRNCFFTLNEQVIRTLIFMLSKVTILAIPK